MKRESKTERIGRLFTALASKGINAVDAAELLRIERTLQRWSEQECGDSNDHASWCIVVDDDGKAFREVSPHNGNKTRRERIPNREAGAKRRLAKIMESYPSVVAFHQGDPRGCALYICDAKTKNIESNYTHGIAVCV